jgi:hypothetical protein
MKHRIIACYFAVLFCGANLSLCAQEESGLVAPVGRAQPPASRDSLRRAFFGASRIVGGQLTLPFKIRQQPENAAFRMTTDVTLGAFVGLRQQFAGKQHVSVTVPVTGGLTFINLDNDNVSVERSREGTEVVPGLSWGTGLILQLEQYTIGLMLGKDYASEVGNQWAHHGKLWWSFGIGFSFAH